MRNGLTRNWAALALTLGLLFPGTPARAEPTTMTVRPADSMAQIIQYYGRPDHYRRPRFYGHMQQNHKKNFYGRSYYYGRTRLHGPKYGSDSRQKYIL